MPYNFNFDLSRMPQEFNKALIKMAYQKNMHKRIATTIRNLVEKLRIQEIGGLNLSDFTTLIEDLVDIHFHNILEREKFQRTKKRALFLPHCSRKYLDGRCQAHFDASVPSYICAGCSPDCLINMAVELGKNKNYDVYILPGGTCLSQILGRNDYDGVVGVACSQELKQVEELLKRRNLPAQAVFLTKNGCANTKFNLKSLEEIL
ncbi:MAG: hypothetical protein APZ16_03030 [Candidatus Hadarchaeum yellowstonense]|jgi:hypothetical protein|uniref:DUF116 domain-containing protein n=1 Tax=Hadarchaeum yellowstonense TaxID=1776334 RepID=A0A147K0T5_HADYE|nr:MAG: hypothetical protein APZ16_03030 [Candidatus Hadarchaeum yellowstonense]